MGNCDAMKMGKGHRVGSGEHQSNLRGRDGPTSPGRKQPHGDHPSKMSDKFEHGERQSGLRDKAD